MIDALWKNQAKQREIPSHASSHLAEDHTLHCLAHDSIETAVIDDREGRSDHVGGIWSCDFLSCSDWIVACLIVGLGYL
uniref:Uncharacterized protein n=1 Tax=Pristionchus pacificus TaxID=54126 RepID=A0A2A6C7A1_PRIPA|eukprot:PDM73980.1 hypothetical protein PRIPAC_41336 [Pristionchus pacificus]